MNLHWHAVAAVVYPDFNRFHGESRCEELMKSMKSYEVWIVRKNWGSQGCTDVFSARPSR